MVTTFYLGTHMPSWLERTDVPMFVSRRRLENRARLPKPLGPWALDSGGFTELSLHGGWHITEAEYLDNVERFASEMGRLEWAAPMDWMCEPFMIERTGLSVQRHQHLTVENYCRLSDAARHLPIIPVLQGWRLADYLRCVDLFGRAGVDLTRERLVGVGSVCRRQGAAEVRTILGTLAAAGLRLHGFGVKTRGLIQGWQFMESADSLAWSLRGRHGGDMVCAHTSCANCLPFALRWRARVLARVPREGQLMFRLDG